MLFKMTLRAAFWYYALLYFIDKRMKLSILETFDIFTCDLNIKSTLVKANSINLSIKA